MVWYRFWGRLKRFVLAVVLLVFGANFAAFLYHDETKEKAWLDKGAIVLAFAEFFGALC